jgi:hypothetical protein
VGGCGLRLSGSEQKSVEEKKTSVYIKCGETDEVSKYQPCRKLNHKQNWNNMCTFIIALFTYLPIKTNQKATL